MTASSKARHARPVVAFVLVILALVLEGCGTSSEDNTAQILIGADELVRSASSHFQSGWPGKLKYTYGDPEWSMDYEAYVDNSRMPDWAKDDYDVCVYWEQPMSYYAMNMTRVPGEPARWHPEGKAWGWILVSDATSHVLELGFEFEGEEPHIPVDAWEGPSEL